MYLDTRDDVIVPEILAYGCHEPQETALLMELVRPSMVFVDVGANSGYYTLLAAKQVGNTGRVYAFEPEPNNYDLLTANIVVNGLKNVFPINQAVSNQNKPVPLFTDKVNLGAHTFSSKNIPVESGGSVSVECTTLDAFFRKQQSMAVDFIKLDTQGAEGLILEGASEVIRRNKLTMLMEFWPRGLRNLETDPSQLLRKLLDLDFVIHVLLPEGKRIEDASRIIEIAEKRDYVNLLLVKNGAKLETPAQTC